MTDDMEQLHEPQVMAWMHPRIETKDYKPTDENGYKIWIPGPQAVTYMSAGSMYKGRDITLLRQKRLHETAQHCLMHMMWGEPPMDIPHGCFMLTMNGEGKELKVDMLEMLIQLMDEKTNRAFDLMHLHKNRESDA